MCFPPPRNIGFAFIRLFYRRRPILFAYAENGGANNEALMMLQQGAVVQTKLPTTMGQLVDMWVAISAERLLNSGFLCKFVAMKPRKE